MTRSAFSNCNESLLRRQTGVLAFLSCHSEEQHGLEANAECIIACAKLGH